MAYTEEGGPAISQRQAEGQLGKQVTIEDLTQPGGVTVGDHTKIELELRELFENIEEGDPTGSAVRNGNLGRENLLPFTTPTAVDTETAVEHSLGRVPVGWRPVAPATVGGSICGSLYVIRAADATYIYLAVRAASDASRRTAIIIW